MCSLARYVMALPAAASQTAATQWLERTLDDSAIRRLIVPQAFLAVDAILNLYLNVVPGLVVHPAVVAHHIAEQLPVHGNRKPLDGGRSGWRRPTGSARTNPTTRTRRRGPPEGWGGRQRLARPNSCRFDFPAARFWESDGAQPGTSAARHGKSTNSWHARSSRFDSDTPTEAGIRTTQTFGCSSRLSNDAQDEETGRGKSRRGQLVFLKTTCPVNSCMTP